MHLCNSSLNIQIPRAQPSWWNTHCYNFVGTSSMSSRLFFIKAGAARRAAGAAPRPYNLVKDGTHCITKANFSQLPEGRTLTGPCNTSSGVPTTNSPVEQHTSDVVNRNTSRLGPATCSRETACTTAICTTTTTNHTQHYKNRWAEMRLTFQINETTQQIHVM